MSPIADYRRLRIHPFLRRRSGRRLARFDLGDNPYPSRAPPLRYTLFDPAIDDMLGRLFVVGPSLHRCMVALQCVQCGAMRCNAGCPDQVQSRNDAATNEAVASQSAAAAI